MDAIAADTPVPAVDDRTAAIVGYLTVIGFFVGIVINSGNRTKLGAFHLRQMLGLLLTMVACGFAAWIVVVVLVAVFFFAPAIGVLLVPVVWLAEAGSIFVMWVSGFINAVQGRMKPMPLLGPTYQRVFGRAFE